VTATYISLDGVSSGSIPEIEIENVTRQIVPTIRDSYVEVPGRAGSWKFDEFGGDRGISATLAVIGDDPDTRRTAVRAVARWLLSPNARKLVVSDEPDRFVWANLSEAPTADELLRRGRVPISFRTSPYAEATAISTEALTEASSTFTITPSVDHADEFLPSIEITAGALLGSGFSLTINGTTLVYGASLAAAAKVTVSSISATVTSGADGDTDLVGAFDGSLLAMTSVDGDFPVLVPGDNSISFTGGAATISVRYRERFV
jgi:predicted phage tail component-like protein